MAEEVEPATFLYVFHDTLVLGELLDGWVVGEEVPDLGVDGEATEGVRVTREEDEVAGAVVEGGRDGVGLLDAGVGAGVVGSFVPV